MFDDHFVRLINTFDAFVHMCIVDSPLDSVQHSHDDSW